MLSSSPTTDERDEALARCSRWKSLTSVPPCSRPVPLATRVARLALQPVEALRKRASTISGDQLLDSEQAQLPVSPVRDEIGRSGQPWPPCSTGSVARSCAAKPAGAAEAVPGGRQPLVAVLADQGEVASPRPVERSCGPQGRADSTCEEAERLGKLIDQLLVLAAADEQRLSVRRRRSAGRVAGAGGGPREAPLRQARTITASRAKSDPRRPAAAGARPWQPDRQRTRPRCRRLILGRRTGDAVRLQVRDQGSGFAADYLARPFERFARSARAGRGNGLGLAIVQAIAEAHGGTAQLGNDGGGSVIMELPARRP